MFVKLLIITALGNVVHGSVLHHNRHCSHIHPTHDEVIHGTHIEPAHVMKKRSLDQQLRIKLVYDNSVFIRRIVELEQQDVHCHPALDREKFELINKTVLPEAVHYWEQALMVRKTESVIRLSRKCEDNQIFIKREDPHPYCKNACEAVTMCGEVQVPQEHLESCRVCNALGSSCRQEGEPAGEGIKDADFVFYVSAMDTDRCHRGQTVAYAAHCQQEVSLDRPIAGHANLCPNSISTKPQELEILISTVKHEILHALGFSVSLYAFYRDSEGNPLSPRGDNGKPELNHVLQARQWSDRVIKKVTRRDWLVRTGRVSREVQMIVTPRVQEEVRNHFGCDTLEGAELEDQGEEGTSLTHWEKRVYENEAMTGTHTQNPTYSRITLALMEDTGWYKANMSMAQTLSWGHNLGCDFAKRSCYDWMEIRTQRGENTHPFCNRVKRDPLETDCTDDRNSVALCNLVEYSSELPPIYQNFESIPHVPERSVGYFGGSVSLADYCPYIQEFTWRADSVAVRGSQCLFKDNNPVPEKNFALETYGNKSRCFNHAGQWEERACKQSRHWQHWGSGCYEFVCNQGRISVMIENKTYTCYYEGQELSVRLTSNDWLHVGGLICPSCQELCGEAFKAQGERCKADREPTEREKVSYHYDQLVCAANNLLASMIPVIIVLYVLLRDS